MILQSKVSNVFHTLQNQHSRAILKELGERQAMTFTEIREYLGFPKNKSSSASHTIKLLVNLKLTTKKGQYYHLTRTGLEAMQLVSKFEAFYCEYSMSELNDEGKVEKYCLVVRRKKL